MIGVTRSSAMSSFDRTHFDFLVAFHRDYMRLSRIVFVILPVKCQKSEIFLTPPVFGVPAAGDRIGISARPLAPKITQCSKKATLFFGHNFCEY